MDNVRKGLKRIEYLLESLKNKIANTNGGGNACDLTNIEGDIAAIKVSASDSRIELDHIQNSTFESKLTLVDISSYLASIDFLLNDLLYEASLSASRVYSVLPKVESMVLPVAVVGSSIGIDAGTTTRVTVKSESNITVVIGVDATTLPAGEYTWEGNLPFIEQIGFISQDIDMVVTYVRNVA